MFNSPVLRSGSTSVLGHTYSSMTTPTARSSEEVDVVDPHGLQQHDGVVQKMEQQEVEAPHTNPRCNLEKEGAARVLGGGEIEAALGQGGVVLASCALPLPSAYIGG